MKQITEFAIKFPRESVIKVEGIQIVL